MSAADERDLQTAREWLADWMGDGRPSMWEDGENGRSAASLAALIRETDAKARAEEREACAKVAEATIGRVERVTVEGQRHLVPPLVRASSDGACREIAAAIRARGEK